MIICVKVNVFYEINKFIAFLIWSCKKTRWVLWCSMFYAAIAVVDEFHVVSSCEEAR